MSLARRARHIPNGHSGYELRRARVPCERARGRLPCALSAAGYCRQALEFLAFSPESLHSRDLRTFALLRTELERDT